MVYKKRLDGRKLDETRPIEAKVGIIKRADGSAMFKIGKTMAYAAVYGPRELYPRFMQDPSKGILRINYNMMPFSSGGERVRPGGGRRSKEISMVTENALSAVVDLTRFPGTVIDVDILVLQANASTRCAGINAAAMALAHAGIVMKEMVASISTGKIDRTLVLDLNKYEDSDFHDGEGSTDIPFTLTSRGDAIAHLQLDGKIRPSEFLELYEMAKKACKKLMKLR